MAEEPVEANPFQEPELPQEEDGKKKKREDPRQGLPTTVDIVEASVPMQLDTTRREDPNNQYIKYTGVATVRIMTEDDWNRVGVDDFTKYCEWNYLNKKMLPRSIFTDKALQYLLRQDDRFRMITVESGINE